MELDRKVQDFPLIMIGPLASMETAAATVSLSMRRLAMMQAKGARKIVVPLSKSFRGSSHFMTNSALVYPSKLLRPSDHRQPFKSTEERIFAIVSGHVPRCFEYFAHSARSLHPLAEIMLSLLGDVDVRL
jgi:hypothetical protein